MDTSPGTSRPPLAAAWDEAAVAYESYFVRRFAPWNERAASPLTQQRRLPDGPLLVACCGPGWEVVHLAALRPSRWVIGVDFSAAMVELTRRRCAAFPNASAQCLDAALIKERWQGQAAGLLSCFGLQQLPDPERAIVSWCEALVPGGVLSVVYWPTQPEADGPFAVLRELITARIPAPDTSWEDRLATALVSAGAKLIRDEPLRYPMKHESAEAVWRAFASSGPMLTLATRYGTLVVDELGRAFRERFRSKPIEHHPAARWIVAQRRR